MPENEMFARILSDYVKSLSMVIDDSVLQDFCAYAKNWLRERGIIGVAQTPNGFALRFRDGTELILIDVNQQTVADQPSFAISGTSGGARPTQPIADTSLKITG